ncbi:TetR/AcrR family transcriptional regulator C-terminal domain-containing protein [Arthrobacter sp.]|uniref:TetR/AcrR family transcriptional regulator C-terminal domain-containing protein n=1 Tax=Arthrobacter sp. TaxID=1667 RepID=UPI0028124A00|nr:TetR/AcrR family transcriptional regulator C-terminal domain-containing protein [Arthrobacter sp.]
MAQTGNSGRRAPLSRERVLHAAVALADEAGVESLSMRKLSQKLDVVPMALYKHVANKEELLDGMVEVIVSEIDTRVRDENWKEAVRLRILSAREAMLRHRWASQVVESRTHAPPVVLEYMDSLIRLFRAGGLSADLTHHVMHALGSRMWGFTQEVFPTPPPPADPEERAALFHQVAMQYPYIIDIATAGSHEQETAVGTGCDDQFEFEFALNLLLDGFERLHQQNWTSGATPDARAMG